LIRTFRLDCVYFGFESLGFVDFDVDDLELFDEELLEDLVELELDDEFPPL